jgi:hypothetical protein
VIPFLLAAALSLSAASSGPSFTPAPFEIVASGSTPADDGATAAAIVEPFLSAGATWWIEAAWQDTDVSSLRRRIHAGPPGLPSGGPRGALD